MPFERSSGVLLHPSALPGRFGIGDLGPAAFWYIDWLAAAGVGWWQILPLHPVGPGFSPYASTSTFAGNPLLISPEAMVADGLLDRGALERVPGFSDTVVEYEQVAAYKEALLGEAWRRYRAGAPREVRRSLDEQRERAAGWLHDWALFSAVFKRLELPWYRWPEPLRRRDEGALRAWRAEHGEEIEREEFAQLLFFRQWHRLRAHAAERGVGIIGDLPIYVADNSAEVWARQELFELDEKGRATAVAGVPPDYFSATGQLWGNPLYNWKRMEQRGFGWWIERMRHAFSMVDAVRLDHFRAFAAYWAVPAGQRDAVLGAWRTGPGRRLFDAIRAALGQVPMIAEDLGLITEDVLALRDELGLPGMAVLQFAFNPDDRSTFLPYNLRDNLVVYTGTHDNNTSAGWYADDADERTRDFVRRYLATDGREIHWDLIRAALASVADLAVVPHQDIAGLGSASRMNTPSRADGNWRFRLADWMLSDWHRARLADLLWIYGRTSAGKPQLIASREGLDADDGGRAQG